MSSSGLTAAQEVALGHEILRAEGEAREALAGVQELAGILGARNKASERTRARGVERLRQALEVARELGRAQPAVAISARVAAEALARADALQWKLAMSEARIAHREARRLGGRFLDAADLVQEGFVGLLDAARRFDPDRGLRFATYARWWVRARMTRAIDTTGRLIRLPGNAVEELRNAAKAERMIGPDADADTIASWAGVDGDRMAWLRAQGPVVSFEEPGPGDDGQRLGDLLVDESGADPEVIRGEGERAEALHAALRTLDPRQQRVLADRFGLRGDDDHSLTDIARRMKLSRERVRQIARKAMSGIEAALASAGRPDLQLA